MALWRIMTFPWGGSTLCSFKNTLACADIAKLSTMHHNISQVVHCRPQRKKRQCASARLSTVPCKIYFIALIWYIDPSCFYTLILHSMLTSCLAKWGSISSKFQRCLESLRGKVCNGETLRRDLDNMLVKKTRWLASSYTQMDGVSKESHTHWSEAPLPSRSWRKWDWTRGGRAGEGVNHRTNAALHHRFLSLPAHPHCQYLTVYTAPPCS